MAIVTLNLNNNVGKNVFKIPENLTRIISLDKINTEG